jgi:hypothetical protein
MYTKIQRLLNSNEQAYQMVQGSGNRKPNILTHTGVQHFSKVRKLELGTQGRARKLGKTLSK